MLNLSRLLRLRGFHTRYVSIVSDGGIHNDWSVRVLVGYRKPPFNKGAGYIGGATLFVCWRCVDHTDMYRSRKRLQVGITQNANRVPWTRH